MGSDSGVENGKGSFVIKREAMRALGLEGRAMS